MKSTPKALDSRGLVRGGAPSATPASEPTALSMPVSLTLGTARRVRRSVRGVVREPRCFKPDGLAVEFKAMSWLWCLRQRYTSVTPLLHGERVQHMRPSQERHVPLKGQGHPSDGRPSYDGFQEFGVQDGDTLVARLENVLCGEVDRQVPGPREDDPAIWLLLGIPQDVDGGP